MENQKSKFLSLKSKNNGIRLGLIFMVSCLILAFAGGTLGLSDTAQKGTVQKGKPEKSPGKDKGGGHETQNLPANVLFWNVTGENGDAILGDGGAYIDGQEHVLCFIGRREGQFILETSHKPTSGRMLYMVSANVSPDFPSGPCMDPPFPFDGWRVARMATERYQEDLRFLLPGQTVVQQLRIILRTGRGEGTWDLLYGTYENDVLVGGVVISPIAFGQEDANGDGEYDPIAWNISTDTATIDGKTSSPIANVIKDYWSRDTRAICGDFSVPFHLTVELQ